MSHGPWARFWDKTAKHWPVWRLGLGYGEVDDTLVFGLCVFLKFSTISKSSKLRYHKRRLFFSFGRKLIILGLVLHVMLTRCHFFFPGLCKTPGRTEF